MHKVHIYSPTQAISKALLEIIKKKGFRPFNGASDYKQEIDPWPYLQLDLNEGDFSASTGTSKDSREITLKELMGLPSISVSFNVGTKTVRVVGDKLHYDECWATKKEVLDFLNKVFNNNLGPHTLHIGDGAELSLGCLNGEAKEFRAIRKFLLDEVLSEIQEKANA